MIIILSKVKCLFTYTNNKNKHKEGKVAIIQHLLINTIRSFIMRRTITDCSSDRKGYCV